MGDHDHGDDDDNRDDSRGYRDEGRDFRDERRYDNNDSGEGNTGGAPQITVYVANLAFEVRES
jgi:hypothetical protein